MKKALSILLAVILLAGIGTAGADTTINSESIGLQTFLATAPYYDACNFAARITCPALVSLGLDDCTSPPPNVQASFNCLASKDKKMVFDADTHHGIRGETLIAVYEWLKR